MASDIERSVKMAQADAYWESKRRPMLDFTEENSLEATAWSLKALAQINPNSAVAGQSCSVAGRPSPSQRILLGNDETFGFRHICFDGLPAAQARNSAPITRWKFILNGEQIISRRVTAAEAVSGQPVVIEKKGVTLSPSSAVRVVKRGPGVAYVAVTQDFYTKEETSDFSAGGLKLTREYLRLKVVEENGKPVWKTEPLTGEIRSGDMIVSRVRVMGAKSQYLLVEDPIPAGCEQVERFSVSISATEFGIGVTGTVNVNSAINGRRCLSVTSTATRRSNTRCECKSPDNFALLRRELN